MKNCRLYNLPIGKTGTVTEVIWKKDVSRRLMELGFIKGEKVKMIKSSPKQNVFIIALRDYQLEIRKNALSLIMVDYE